MAKKASGFMLLAVLFVVLLTVSAAAEVNINVNGKKAVIEEASNAFIVDGRIIAEAKTLGEILNTDGSVTYEVDGAFEWALYRKGDLTVKVYAGKNDAEINGNATAIGGIAPMIIDGKLFVPYRFVAANLGFTVNWDSFTETSGAMDEVTSDYVFSLIEAQRASLGSVSKTSFALKSDVKIDAVYTPDVPDESHMYVEAFIEQDIENTFQHVQMSMSSTGVNPPSLVMEVYDDGEFSYTNYNGNTIRGKSNITDPFNETGTTFEQYDLGIHNDTTKTTYAGILIDKDEEGSIHISGSMEIPVSSLGSSFQNSTGDLARGAVMDVKLTEPIFFEYVFDANGIIKSYTMRYKVSMSMYLSVLESEYHMDAEYNTEITDITLDADFESTVPIEFKAASIQY